jgi:hypothetical protein
VRNVGVGRVGVCILCTCVSEEGGGEKSAGSESLFCCHTHLDTSVSRTLTDSALTPDAVRV